MIRPVSNYMWISTWKISNDESSYVGRESEKAIAIQNRPECLKKINDLVIRERLKSQF